MSYLFSIIIPTLNEQQGIESCLQALQSLRSKAEIIIADGASNDKTIQLATPLVDKIILAKKGRASQMNAGAKQASGEILIFLHADTYLPDNTLELITEGFKQNKKWGRFEIELIGQSPMLKVIAYFMNWRSRLTKIATGDQVIFIEKNLFQQLKGYPEIELMEDITFCARLKKRTSPLCLTAKVKSSARRWEEFGIFKIILLMWSLRLRYWFGQSPKTLAKLYRTGRFF